MTFFFMAGDAEIITISLETATSFPSGGFHSKFVRQNNYLLKTTGF